jgi:hypothetical protein
MKWTVARAERDGIAVRTEGKLKNGNMEERYTKIE